MRLELRLGDADQWDCYDPDHPDGPELLGDGRSPDEAIGEAVRSLYLREDVGVLQVNFAGGQIGG